jgi:hypothetical protein
MRVSMAFRLTAASEIKGEDRDAPHQHLSWRHMEVTLLFFLQEKRLKNGQEKMIALRNICGLKQNN